MQMYGHFDGFPVVQDDEVEHIQSSSGFRLRQ